MERASKYGHSLPVIALMITISLVGMFVMLGVQEKNIEARETKLLQLEYQNQEYLDTIESLNTRVAQMEAEIDEKKELEEKVKNIEQYINLDNTDNVARANKITEGTPLDFETACVVVEYAEEFEINPSLILAVIDLESNFEQYEVGSANDRGYMQIIPSTEKWLVGEFGEKLGIAYDPEQIFEPKYNIGLGAAYLSLLKDVHGEDYNRILSEYNRGPYNLKRYYEANNTYVTTYSKVVLSKEKKYLAYND
ncbi:MAG: transglycosylase SLT domain-containing protein [Clostridia bacterium]|nr:transglycosylase SLT domain-containing protein [Clostridia bacterium]